MIIGLERDTLETVVFRFRQPVKIAKPRVRHRPVRINETLYGKVPRIELTEVLDRLSPQARLQPRVIHRVELFIWREHPQAVQLQPLPRKVVDETVDFAVAEQPIHFVLQPLAVQVTLSGGSQQSVIGHGAPQEIREPRGEFPIVETFAGFRRPLDKIEEMSGDQYPLHRHPISLGSLFTRLAFGLVCL